MENKTKNITNFEYRLLIIKKRAKKLRITNSVLRLPFKALFAIMCLMFMLVGCGKEGVGEKAGKKIERALQEEGDTADRKDIDIEHKVQNFKLEGFTKGGKGRWYIRGEIAKMLESDIILDKIKGESRGRNINVALTADRCIFNKNSGATELRGNVIVTTSDGGKVTTEYARWNRMKEEIETDAYVEIVHNGITLEGRGARILPKQKWAMLNSEIKAVDSTSRVITCDGPLEVNYEEKKAIFSNNVEIVDNGTKMYANKVIAYFDPDKREIEKIEWIGDVKAVY